MQPFISLRRVALVGNSVVLLSKFSDAEEARAISMKGQMPLASNWGLISPGHSSSGETYDKVSKMIDVDDSEHETSWNLYVIRQRPLKDLFAEMMHKAEVRTSCHSLVRSVHVTYFAQSFDDEPSVYFQLALEAHTLLKARIQYLRMQQLCLPGQLLFSGDPLPISQTPERQSSPSYLAATPLAGNDDDAEGSSPFRGYRNEDVLAERLRLRGIALKAEMEEYESLLATSAGYLGEYYLKTEVCRGFHARSWCLP